MKIEVIKKGEMHGHNGPIYALSEGRSEMEVLSGSSDKFVAGWDLSQMAQSNLAIQMAQAVYSVCWAPEQNWVLIGNGIGGIHVVDMEERREAKLLQIHSAPVFDLKYSARHQCFFSASADGGIARVDLKNFNVSTKKICAEKVRQLSLDAAENNLGVAAGDGNIYILDPLSLQEKTIITAHKLSANAVVFHPNGKQLVSGGRDAHLNIWDIENNFGLEKSIPAHNFAIYGISFSPGGNLFATASRDKTIKIWESNNYRLLKRIDRKENEGHSHSINRILWHSKGLLVSAGDDRKIMAWDILY